jgi:hypothetical protein
MSIKQPLYRLTQPLRHHSTAAASILCMLLLLWSPISTFAITLTDGEEAQLNGTWAYDPSACSQGDASTGTGTLPAYIPDPYNTAFTNAGNKYNVSPALVAGIFTEENMTQTATSQLNASWQQFLIGDFGGVDGLHRPPGASGVNSGWNSSSAGASGPFQFLPSTWTGLGYSISDIDNLDIAADAAANYLAQGGATTNKPPSSWNGAIYDYNHAQWYVDAVMEYYNFYNSGQTTTTAPAPTTTSSCGQTGNVSCQGAVPTGTSGLSTLRQQIVCNAENQLTIWKSKPGYGTPNFPFGAKGFLPYSQERYELWCADFATWVYNQAGWPVQTPDWNIAYVPNIQAIGQAGARGFTWHPAGSGYTPVPGDLAIHGTTHVNIFISYTKRKIGSTTVGEATYIGGDQGNGPYYGTRNPPSDSIVSTEVWPGYWASGDPQPITGYVSPSNGGTVTTD